MKARNMAILIFVVMVVASLFLWWGADSFADWSMTGDVFLVSVAYMLTTPAYIALLILLYQTRKIRGLIAGFFMIVAFDIMSWAHYIRMAGLLPTEASSYVGFDTLLYKFILSILGYFPLGTFGLYVLTPILLMMISLEILGYVSFIALFKKVVGVS